MRAVMVVEMETLDGDGTYELAAILVGVATDLERHGITWAEAGPTLFNMNGCRVGELRIEGDISCDAQDDECTADDPRECVVEWHRDRAMEEEPTSPKRQRHNNPCIGCHGRGFRVNEEAKQVERCDACEMYGSDEDVQTVMLFVDDPAEGYCLENVRGDIVLPEYGEPWFETEEKARAAAAEFGLTVEG